MRYFDSGVLLKLYLSEPNSAEAAALVQERGGLPPLTPLHRLEMKAALGQKCGRGDLSVAEHAAVLTNLESDCSLGVYADPSLDWPRVFARAESLAAAHASANLCRSLDTLHVALAFEIGATEFCTFDARQAAMAATAGLVVIP